MCKLIEDFINKVWFASQNKIPKHKESKGEIMKEKNKLEKNKESQEDNFCASVNAILTEYLEEAMSNDSELIEKLDELEQEYDDGNLQWRNALWLLQTGYSSKDARSFKKMLKSNNGNIIVLPKKAIEEFGWTTDTWLCIQIDKAQKMFHIQEA